MNKKRCKCGKLIMFTKTGAGQFMPFDTVKTKVLVDGKVVDGYISHFITCPLANVFKKKLFTKEGSSR